MDGATHINVRLTCFRGADITDNDPGRAAVTAEGLFSDVPAQDANQRRTAVDDSPAAMMVLRAPFAVPSQDMFRGVDDQQR